METIMTMVHIQDTGLVAMATLVAGLKTEFGNRADGALAQYFLDAEESDFLWEARNSERWLGAHENIDDADLELDRVAIMGRLDGRWFVAVSIVDGDGNAHRLISRRSFEREAMAREAYAAAH